MTQERKTRVAGIADNIQRLVSMLDGEMFQEMKLLKGQGAQPDELREYEKVRGALYAICVSNDMLYRAIGVKE